MSNLRRKYFTYKSLEDLRTEAAALAIDMTFEENISALATPLAIGNRTVGNRLAVHPMEGCDGTLQGEPGELTVRRWERFGRGGAKLIWGEATAVVPEGRANVRQLLISHATVDSLARMLDKTRAVHREEFGNTDDLLVGLQLTHSGRFSVPHPIVVCANPVVDAATIRRKPEYRDPATSLPIITDDELKRLTDAYIEAARLAHNAGFDFVDVKQCHTYLLNELLGARTRGGEYGGSFENRTRFVRDVLTGIRQEVGNGLLLASRVNVYDGIPFQKNPESGMGEAVPVPLPYQGGFGNSELNPQSEDLSEPLALIGLLRAHGVTLVNVTAGSPYFNPHIGRPYEQSSAGGYASPEHPLIGVERHFRLAEAVQRAYPDLAVVGTGYSWLQKYFIYAAESNIRRGRVSIVGAGRGAMAYPEFAREALAKGALDSKKVCLTVSYCTDLMRAKDHPLGQYPAGCVPRDDVYADLYKELQSHKNEVQNVS